MSDHAISLLPLPTSIVQTPKKFRLNKDFTLTATGNFRSRLPGAMTRFLRRLDGRTGLFFNQGYLTPQNLPESGPLTLQILSPGMVRLGMDESYQLTVREGSIILKAPTDIGAIRGLETLLQLLDADDHGYYFPCCDIRDTPRFPWRGLLVDVSRHFLPLEKLKQNIDGLAAVKMNVLHLHLTDDQGIRFQSQHFPELTEKASDGMFYTRRDLKELVDYADDRGIRIVPEINVPGHGTAFVTAFPELASAPGPYSLERRAGIMDPTLDPTNEKTYEFLQRLLEEVAAVFPDEYFHIGGDENEGRHWDKNPHIQRFMREKQLMDNHALQNYFNQRLLKILTGLGKKMMGWDEIFHSDLSKDAIIQSWRGKDSLYQAAEQGHQCLLSNGYYIDLALPAREHYLNDPIPEGQKISQKAAKNILGGEATMWSELVTPLTIDSRIWPRTAAIAERLWSWGALSDTENMYQRLEVIGFQLEELGLQHHSAREVIMRNLCRGGDIEPLKTLVEVIEPMKNYTRNPEGELYTMYSPFTLLADAARPDSKTARNFTEAVSEFTTIPTDKNRKFILQQLRRWKNHYQPLKNIIRKSPALSEASNISYNLYRISRLAILAMEGKLKQKEKAEEAIKEARQQGGRTELQIVDPIEKLISELTAE